MLDWATIISYFIHLIATVIWLGGIAINALVIYPRFTGAAVSAEMNRKYQPLALIAMAALWFSGLNQMAVNPHYAGFLTLGNVWSVAILAKHGFVIVMMLLTAYTQWVNTPELKRQELLKAKGKLNGDGVTVLLKREALLNQLNLICGLIVLFCTAVARAA